jgi:hypothetical protein
MTRKQTIGWLWCFGHLAIAGYVQMCAHESLSMTTLSHLVFFDVLAAFLCVAVDISRNFEVWHRSTISHPFGLERSEVLAGLAMSIILLFMGIDLISHGLTHALEGGHAHQPHHHDHDSPRSRAFAALLAFLTTLLSIRVLAGQGPVGEAIDVSLFRSLLPRSARTQGHLLPLSLSGALFILPLIGIPIAGSTDVMFGVAYALAMIALGALLCYGIGRMLLMSYSRGGAVREVVQAIERDRLVAGVDEAKVWQVHYGLCMASFRLRVHDAADAATVRDRVDAHVRMRLRAGHEKWDAMRWEVSTQIAGDR